MVSRASLCFLFGNLTLLSALIDDIQDDRLKEAIRLFDDDWKKIADMLENRSKVRHHLPT